MKNLLFTITLIFFSTSLIAQNMDHDHEAMMKENAVKEVLKAYKSALENLDVSNTQHLFAEDATVFENGKFEGTYQDYLDNHIGPELGHFKEFSFNNYEVSIRLEGDMAVAHETYTYKIVLDDEEPRIVERQGVATSVLKNFDGEWKIIQNHGSSRTIRN
ncbi:MAG: nuclear transport factor 2 family protein [Balneolaceae bacterium]|nr:nuclear transport factor 2 family protein [Balneolaceae bacterium]